MKGHVLYRAETRPEGLGRLQDAHPEDTGRIPDPAGAVERGNALMVGKAEIDTVLSYH